MQETKIKGLKVLYDNTKIKICQSYQLKSLEKIYPFLVEMIRKYEGFPPNFIKPLNLMYIEWKIQNILYNMKIFRNKTQNYTITKKINLLALIITYIKGDRKEIRQWMKKRKK